MYSHLKVAPPKGGKGRRSIERQIHLTVVTPVLLLLISNVFANQRLVTSHSADLVASRPELLAGEIPAAAFAMPRNPDCALAFDEAENRAHLVFWRNGYQVDMVGHHMPLLDPALFWRASSWNTQPRSFRSNPNRLLRRHFGMNTT